MLSTSRRWALRRGRSLLAILTIASAVVLAGGDVAQAHQWGSWHWHRGGNAVYIYVQNNCGSYYNVCEAARQDIHNRPHVVYLVNTSYHSDIEMLSGYYGYTGWAGLAQVWGSYGHITHAHATLNLTYMAGYSAAAQQGVQCQELAHTLGLDHAATGDCMALGYYSGGTNYFGQYRWDTGGYSHPTGDLNYMYKTLK